VTKLLNAVRPEVAVFGEKDFQQLAVIRRLAIDLNLGARIVGVPTVRDEDGLALSSRNAYLSDDERARAAALPDALYSAADGIEAGEPVDVALEKARRGWPMPDLLRSTMSPSSMRRRSSRSASPRAGCG
jgi:pantoate--beta-alanine ligase